MSQSRKIPQVLGCDVGFGFRKKFIEFARLGVGDHRAIPVIVLTPQLGFEFGTLFGRKLFDSGEDFLDGSHEEIIAWAGVAVEAESRCVVIGRN